jgi:hypothetical protein
LKRAEEGGEGLGNKIRSRGSGGASVQCGVERHSIDQWTFCGVILWLRLYSLLEVRIAYFLRGLNLPHVISLAVRKKNIYRLPDWFKWHHHSQELLLIFPSSLFKMMWLRLEDSWLTGIWKKMRSAFKNFNPCRDIGSLFAQSQFKEWRRIIESEAKGRGFSGIMGMILDNSKLTFSTSTEAV